MKKILFFVFAFLVTQAQAQTYSRVRIYANAQQQAQLHQTGICLDHGKYKENTWIETDLSDEEITTVRQQGIQVEILTDAGEKVDVGGGLLAITRVPGAWAVATIGTTAPIGPHSRFVRLGTVTAPSALSTWK